VPPNETYNTIARTWGAVATTIAWPETYLALSQGVVDAIETAPGPSFDQKHYEVAKNLIRTNHLIYFHVWVISDKSWQNWPQKVRDAVMTAATEAAGINRQARLKQEVGIFDEYAKRGMTIIDPDREEFAASLKGLQESVKPELKPLLQRVQAAA
jgi:TRAP-type C4-dicarboxylate transport system substrate-binding protein